MADVRLSPQQMVDTGVIESFTGSLATTNTYVVRNSGRMVLHFKKANAVNCDVTVQTPKTVGGLAVSEQVVRVLASGGDKVIGPFTPSLYNDGFGDVRFTLSDVDGLTVSALEM
jgi:hypothetical protein